MFPYVPHPTITIGAYELTAFRVLVLVAILYQYFAVVRFAPRFDLDAQRAGTLCVWATGIGLVSAHVFDVLTYFPERLSEDPLALFKFWGSLSSTGGMLGGLLGVLVVMRVQRMPVAELVRFLDLCWFALPGTLAIGRLGCALQHDHLGAASTHFLAVNFPDGPRFDLGLLEFLYASLLCGLFWFLVRRPRPTGLYFGLFFALYGPVRFVLDSLRTGDARYAGLTPAQWLMIAATALGVAVVIRVSRRTTASEAGA